MALSGKGKRAKGARGEREFFDLLNKLLPERLQMKRLLGQARDGGGDGKNEFVSVEVKRQEKARLNAWLAQARLGSTGNRVPVVAHRANGSPWCILVEMDMVQFAAWLKHRNNLLDTEADLRYQQDAADNNVISPEHQDRSINSPPSL